MPLTLNTALNDLQPSGIRRFSALAAQTPGCISLTLGEPGEDTPERIAARVQVGLDAHKTHYPPNNGWPDLRLAICARMAATGLSYQPEEVVVTSGATEALYATLSAMLNPGDEVIVPMPAFLLYESVVRLARATVVPLATDETGFQITEEALAASVTERTKAIVLTSPNNPTGVCLSRESLDVVARLACEHQFYVICDDVYDQLVYSDDFVGFAKAHQELREQTVVVNSFSKPYAMTGWRLGWLAAPHHLTDQIAKIHQYAISSVVSFTQDAAIEALATDVTPMRESYRVRRDFVLARLARMGLSCVRPDGAFYAFPSIRKLGLTSEEFCTRAIIEDGVALVPGSVFGCEGHVRLSYACDVTTLRWGLDRLEKFVAKLS
ncbi:MAG: pyridoxal phosphate-dependent aminotransferase [Atopobiaceae bacterium]|nr:pyridoxal phosphate-dependent aminotransferase [Atopobiaceae bacterium]